MTNASALSEKKPPLVNTLFSKHANVQGYLVGQKYTKTFRHN